MKHLVKSLFCAALITTLGCQKSDTSPIKLSETSQSLLSKATDNNSLLTSKILSALGDNIFEQYGSRQFEITSVGDEQVEGNKSAYKIEYATSDGQPGSALLIADNDK